ncbi:biotin-dependent carboxyltransferase family protein [Accumulibacter sp.]|uniref:5-oxoprolinase subunit C family protein n=1 Tax=Accumulibacter sp. TaxID=2053492 RepID=UPI0025E61F18|nr:biotin-dependent carboxyltransferase family protein [Accumulibacter sp.]MCM8594463.1 biotin-dependent carboxyltransferase family protein [Accumulibacter sp.]MCM8626728.1 biotin-dependent carboxyltransferase family protein [Accumulibacter sp.]MDS4048609.1 biotin-dependent carboxyltransferase family protein [Accumulibacter sp.]
MSSRTAGLLEIVHPGAWASLQDLGRPGLRRIGVPRSGALEPGWLRLANALLGNAEDCPAIEMIGGGLVVRALGEPLQVALAGRLSAEVGGTGSRRRLPSWRSLTLAPGETLRCVMLSGARVGYLALAGIDVPRRLGSASTCPRAALGGLDGQLLGPGDRIPGALIDGSERRLAAAPESEAEPIRVVLGPQDDHFERRSLARFLDTAYRVSGDADRMGLRLEGPRLRHAAGKGAEIVSDATVPGSIQVPGHGLPIVLLADGQTIGGYPKIATVISADLPRLAVLAPGQTVRFTAVAVSAAENLARAREAALRAAISAIVELPHRGEADLQALYGGANLISGVVDACPGRAGGARGAAQEQP